MKLPHKSISNEQKRFAAHLGKRLAMEQDEERAQWALFDLSGPDERGWVWLTANGVTVNLGLRDEVADKLSQWLTELEGNG